MRQKWTDREFSFNIDFGWAPNLISRISDVSTRCRYHFDTLSDDFLSKRMENKWSIKEHIGHLVDLVELHCERLNEFRDLKTELSAADMSNVQTETSDHNATALDDLLTRLGGEREKFVQMYRSLNYESLQHQSPHPRLNRFMRPVDLLCFAGEHDDHHICSMLVNKRMFKTE